MSGVLRLVLARHGQTPANVAHALDTRLPGPGLTDLGRAQAEALGRELAAEAVDGGQPVAAVYHSEALRAAQTAALAAAPLRLVPRRVDGVYEVQAGDLEGRSDDEAIAAFQAVFDAWLSGDLEPRLPGGESAHDVLGRFLPAVERVRAAHPDGGTVVLVCHGGTLRLGAPALVAGDERARRSSREGLGNCGRIVLRAEGTGWALETWSADVPGDLPATHDATG